jgi:phosphoglucomutase
MKSSANGVNGGGAGASLTDSVKKAKVDLVEERSKGMKKLHDHLADEDASDSPTEDDYVMQIIINIF